MHFGVVTPPVSGHLHPFGALGRELIARGHRVTVFHMPDLEERVRAEDLEFAAIGHEDHPHGTLPASVARIGQLDGLAALRFTIQEVRKTTEMMLRDGPEAISKLNVDALLVDQTEPAGATIAERLMIPFVTICNALALNREPDVPPPFTGWSYCRALWARVRNRAGYTLSDRVLHPVQRVVSEYRQRWKLSAYRGHEESFSPLAQISQQPPAFDFPRRHLTKTFHYTGPLRRPSSRAVTFPWDKLDGRPLVYASLGTLQNGKEQVFRCFAEACLDLPVQLVITHGGGLDEKTASSFPGDPVVVSYAPQLEVLSRARLTLTHAGLNTVLDSLSFGVPLVAVPITYEQPAIAQRLAWSGAGEIVPFRRISASRVRQALERVLNDPSFTENAKTVERSIRDAGGVSKAADVIEQVVA
jgi:zeaxanthin glucosyltransferase